MKQFLITAAASLGALSLAATAQAQTAEIQLQGNVDDECALGAPTQTVLDLGDLTGTDGRLTPTLKSSSVSASTTIASAWCNGPSVLSINAEPMDLEIVPGYPSPSGFSRLITYTATVSGWPAAVVDRPVVGSGAQTTPAGQARAEELLLEISELQTLNGAGSAEADGMVLEAGTYKGTVTITLGVAP